MQWEQVDTNWVPNSNQMLSFAWSGDVIYGLLVPKKTWKRKYTIQSILTSFLWGMFSVICSPGFAIILLWPEMKLWNVIWKTGSKERRLKGTSEVSDAKSVFASRILMKKRSKVLQKNARIPCFWMNVFVLTNPVELCKKYERTIARNVQEEEVQPWKINLGVLTSNFLMFFLTSTLSDHARLAFQSQATEKPSRNSFSPWKVQSRSVVFHFPF